MTDLEALRERVRVATGELDWQDAVRIALIGRGDIQSLDGPHSGDAGEDEYSAWILSGGERKRVHVSDFDRPDHSLDDALALVEALLPGRGYTVYKSGTPKKAAAYWCLVAGFGRHRKRAHTPHLAVLDALLSALIAQQVEAS